MSFGGTVKLTGESEYKKALGEITGNLKLLGSEMKVVTSQYDKNDKSVESLSSQNEVLTKQIGEQEKKVGILRAALEKSKEETGENSETTKKWQMELNNAQADLNKLNRSLGDNKKALADAEKTESKTTSGLKGFAKTLLECGAGSKNLGDEIKGGLSKKLDTLKDGFGENVTKVKDFASGVGTIVGDMKQMGVVAGISVAALKLFKEEMDETGKETEETADDVEDVGEEAEETGEKALKLGDIIKANLISDAIKGGISALADGVKAVGSAMGEALTAGAAYADTFLTLSAQTGLSTDTLEKYNAVAELADVSVETFTGSLAKTTKAMGEAQKGSTKYVEAYKQLGVSVKDANGNLRDSEDVYWETVDALKGIENETERDALAMELFGKSAQDLNTIIDMGSEGFKELEGTAIDMGAVLGGDALASLGALDDEMQIFKSTTSSTGNILASAFAPAVTSVLGSVNGLGAEFNGLLSAIVSGDEGGIENAISNVTEMIWDVVGNIEDMLPVVGSLVSQILDVAINLISSQAPLLLEEGAKMLGSLLSGISSKLGSILPVVASVFQTLTSTILSSLPMLLEMGIQMLVSLTEGIASMLPELIPLAIDALLNLCETLIDNLDLIVDAGIELIMSLADGLLEALPKFIDKAPFLIDKLVSAILNNLDKILDSGIDLILALADGLVVAIPKLLEQAPLIIGKIVSALIKEVPTLIKAGGDLLAGLFKGLLNPTTIANAVKSLFNGIVGGIKKIFGIHSPSTVMADLVGANLALGVGEGFTDTMGDVSAEMASAIPTEFDANISTSMGASAASHTSTYDMMVSAFEQALTKVKVVMDDREMGGFVTNAVERVVYA